MLSDYLPAIEGFGILQGITLLLFFGFFIALVIWVWRLDKQLIREMEYLPLDHTNLEIKLPGEHND